MIPRAHLPSPCAQVAEFVGSAGTAMIPFDIPKSARFVLLWLVGGGGGGGGGRTAGTGSTKGGGGGGGGGGLARWLGLASVLPPRIYLTPGVGGAGGTGSGVAGSAGTRSYVSAHHDTSLLNNNSLLISGAANAGGGAAGTTSAGGAAGAAGTVYAGAGLLSGLGLWDATAGGTGGAGSHNAATANLSFATNKPILGGTGGGGYVAAGSARDGGSIVTSSFVLPDLPGGLTGTPPTAGQHGYWADPYPFVYGGTGGGGGNGGGQTGGTGGDGAYGSGGGGGGAGNAGGPGGRGGDGYIAVVCW